MKRGKGTFNWGGERPACGSEQEGEEVGKLHFEGGE